MIPIPTGAFFMALLYLIPASRRNTDVLISGSSVATGEFGHQRDELTGTDRFGDVHLVTRRQRLDSIFITRVSTQGSRRRFAAFLSRQRSYFADEAITVFFRHRDVAQNHIGAPLRHLH